MDETQNAAPSNTVTPASDTATATATVGGGKNVVLPSHAVGKLKSEARERGRREAMTELESQAKAAGFESLQAMFSTTAALLKNQQKPQQQAKPTTQLSRNSETQREAREDRSSSNRQPQGGRAGKDQLRYERQLERERKAREEERRIRLSEEKRRKNLERSKEALEAEMHLREQAIMSGCKDVDYAVTLLKRSIEGKSESELQGFNEVEFFDSLREKSPYLFGEVVRPVTTGTGAAAREPMAPKAGQVTKNAATGAQTDTRGMNDAQFREHLRKRGLDLPGF